MSSSETVTLIAKCTRCGELTKATREVRTTVIAAGPMAGRMGTEVVGGYRIDCCSSCGAFLTETKAAKVSKTRCTDKCVSSTGPACSCECGGRNHGGHA